MSRFGRQLWFAPAVLMLFAGAAQSQDSKEEPKRGGFLIDPKQMLDQALRDTSRRYNLDSEQKDLAKEIIGEHGKRFFDKHWDEIKALQMEAMKLRISGEEDPETIKALGKRFKVIFEDARKVMEESGDEFHKILDEDQAKQHDDDRKMMREGLDRAAEMLDKTIADGITPWARSRMENGESADAQRRRMRWTGGGLVEREWEAYVQAFIMHYKLDDTQTGRANQMLELAKKDAADFRKSREAEIKDIVDAYRKLAAAEKEKGKDITSAEKADFAAKRKALDGESEKLEKPLETMFKDLREALDTLPTDEQKRKAGPFGKRK